VGTQKKEGYMPETNRFTHVDAVKPVSEADEAVFAEIRAVLVRHKALNRFGVTLLHDHFDISDDEILVESCDPDSRTLVTRPMKKAELAGEQLLETNWTLDAPLDIEAGSRPHPQPVKTCRAVCQQVRGKGHSRLHYPI
jgi:hypothetical protein